MISMHRPGGRRAPEPAGARAGAGSTGDRRAAAQRAAELVNRPLLLAVLRASGA